ncbi:hypothetical protein DFJ58DRAFT_843117 [Suillus subalutaceus]|uniref:uncharacterized protein n=1 Tax=Suillus subalutaceus TaxID=48586 RepID=UPI001B85C832|nr:uncharacterized protein DFJ58DRAFT_843117 [Suillus subalutaceus]KAG1847672.1 hypothetical protein DFJ58DRAFT_843117 [Suillus subalutaceus]
MPKSVFGIYTKALQEQLGKLSTLSGDCSYLEVMQSQNDDESPVLLVSHPNFGKASRFAGLQSSEPDNNLGNMFMRINTRRVSKVALTRSFDYSDCQQCLVRSKVYSQFLLIILDSPAASESDITIINNTSSTIYVRITADSDTGTTTFDSVESGDSGTWDRTVWQVAFVLKGSGAEQTMVVKPGQNYTVNE